MLRMMPWCLVRTSSTRWSADRRLSVPESAWLTSSRVESRRDSRAWTTAGSVWVRTLGILAGNRANRVLVRDRHRAEERHEGAQFRADLFQLLHALFPPPRFEPLAARGVLVDPAFRVLSGAD